MHLAGLGLAVINPPNLGTKGTTWQGHQAGGIAGGLSPSAKVNCWGKRRGANIPPLDVDGLVQR